MKIEEYKFAGKKAIVRVDFNVPLDENGKISPALLQPIIFDPVNNAYLKLGEKVGNAFSDGAELK